MVAPALPGPPCPSKDSDARQHNRLFRPFRREEARQEEGATRPPDRARPGAGARRGCRIRGVLVRFHRAGLVPADHRVDDSRRPFRRRRGQTRLLRNPADLRGLRRRPLPRPGIRPGPGPLLGDGRPAAHDVRSALRDVRFRTGGDRFLPAHPRLAEGGAEGVRRGPGREHQEEPPVVRGGRQRVSEGQGRPGHLGRVRGSGADQRLQARRVDPGRLGRLAEGDGLGPARQHAGRDRPFAADQPPRQGPDRGPVPRLPVQAAQADRRAGCDLPGHREVRPRGDPVGHHRIVDPRGRHRWPEHPAGRPLGHPRRDPGAARPERQRHRFELLGRLRRAHDLRQGAARERPAPRADAALPLVPDGPALPGALQDLPVRHGRLHVLRYARCDHRSQPGHRLGPHQPGRRRHRPLPGEGLRRRLPVRRRDQVLQDPRGDHQGRRMEGTGPSPSARRTTAPWSPTAARNSTRSARRPRSATRPPTVPTATRWR